MVRLIAQNTDHFRLIGWAVSANEGRFFIGVGGLKGGKGKGRGKRKEGNSRGRESRLFIGGEGKQGTGRKIGERTGRRRVIGRKGKRRKKE